MQSLVNKRDSKCFPFHLDTWKKDVKVQDIEDAINGAAPGKLRVISVSEVISFFFSFLIKACGDFCLLPFIFIIV